MSVVEVARGDITGDPSDAIVNAANSSLLGGGGVDGAIHSAGGPAILQECRTLRATLLPDGLATGHAVATTAGTLPAGMVIHTVGPKRWEHQDGGAQFLADCHTSSLDVAAAAGARSVAFPAISCGVYGWSPQEAAPVAVAAVHRWLAEHPESGVQRVRFVLFNDAAEQAFARVVDAADGT